MTPQRVCLAVLGVALLFAVGRFAAAEPAKGPDAPVLDFLYRAFAEVSTYDIYDRDVLIELADTDKQEPTLILRPLEGPRRGMPAMPKTLVWKIEVTRVHSGEFQVRTTGNPGRLDRVRDVTKVRLGQAVAAAYDYLRGWHPPWLPHSVSVVRTSRGFLVGYDRGVATPFSFLVRVSPDLRTVEFSGSGL